MKTWYLNLEPEKQSWKKAVQQETGYSFVEFEVSLQVERYSELFGYLKERSTWVDDHSERRADIGRQMGWVDQDRRQSHE